MRGIKKRLLLAAIIFMCAAPVATYAQFGGELEGGEAFGEGPGDDLPIDGGVSLLLAAGIGYGAKKLYEKRNNKTENKDK